MEIQSLNRYSTLSFINGKNLRNRVVVPPMASQTADKSGFVTQKTLDHYQRLSQAGAGLLMVEYTFVHLSGRSEEHQLGIQSDEHIGGLSKLANTIKSSGAIAGIQLTHAGGKTDRTLTGGALMAPSDVAVPIKGGQLETPNPMNAEEIALWVNSFVSAAARAKQAGFDLVELHAAHGYGLNQWISPITNKRTDSFGGTIQNRAQLLIRIVEQIRHCYPDLLIAVRMPGQDFIENGLTFADTIALAKILEQRGVSIIDVSSGIGGWRRPNARTGEGYLVPEATIIQKAVNVPVIGVGGIQTGPYIDESLRAGLFSLAGVGRAILESPEAFRKNVLTANYEKAFGANFESSVKEHM
ncbi:MAG: NADH:flavin oxidoreductase [Bdellovibrio sp.]